MGPRGRGPSLRRELILSETGCETEGGGASCLVGERKREGAKERAGEERRGEMS